MADISMCQNHDCAAQDTCWRLNAPPDLHRQSYSDFTFDDDEFEKSGASFSDACSGYLDMGKF